MVLFAFDSRDRPAGSTSDSFFLRLPSPMTNVKGIEVDSAVIPCSWYNFDYVPNGIMNNRVPFATYNSSGTLLGTYLVILTPSNHTYATLTAALTSQMTTAAGFAITVTFDYQTGLLTFTCATGYQLAFLWSTSTDSAVSCWYELGFNKADTPMANVVTAPNQLDVSGEKYVYLKIRNLPPNVMTPNHANDAFALFIAPENTPYISWQNPESTAMPHVIAKFDEPLRDLSFLEISLEFFGGRRCDLKSREWTCVLRIIT